MTDQPESFEVGILAVRFESQMTEASQSWMGVLKTTIRFLIFRSTREEMLSFGGKHLALGLFFTWLVGVGRYWDNPRVSLLQHTGIGSIIYVFVLALLLYLIASALKPKDWSYFRVLTFVSLVAPPAVLYAIPVERFFDLDAANSINASFLAVVAAWRVALLIFYLKRFAALDWISVVTVTLVPLTFIVVTLTILNLDRVVFDFMGGISPTRRSGNDQAYGILFLLSVLSFMLFVPALTCYIILAVSTYFARRDERLRQLSIGDDSTRRPPTAS